MKIKNNFLVVLFFVFFLSHDIVIAMDQPISAQETLRPIDQVLINACKNKKTLEFALSNGANPNIFDKDGLPSVDGTVGFTPLLYACLFGDLDKIKLLLDHGADVNLKSKNGIPPLYLLFSSSEGSPEKRYELGKFLMSRGADVNLKGPGNHSVLQVAIQSGSDKFALFLLEDGRVDVNSVDSTNMNALTEALLSGKEKLLHKLFDAGCVPISDTEGASLIHKASQLVDLFFRGNVAILDFLVGKGLDVNALDKYGQTPLHWASETAPAEVVKKLLELGADPEKKDNNNKTAYQLSLNNPDKRVQRLLKNKKKPVNIQQIPQKEKLVDIKTAAHSQGVKDVGRKATAERIANVQSVKTAKKIQPAQTTSLAPIETKTAKTQSVSAQSVSPQSMKKPEIQQAPKAQVSAGDVPVERPVVGQGGVASNGKPKAKTFLSTVKEEVKAVKKAAVGVLNPEKREESAQELIRSYAVAAGAPVRRAEQPQEKMITYEDDDVEVMIPIMRKVNLENPLVGLIYSDHVKETMARKHDYFHSFSTNIEQNFGKFTDAEIMKSATRKHSARIKYTLPATVKMFGKKQFSGKFEFIVKDGKMEHRFFKPDKQVREKKFSQKDKAPLLLH